jgi:hypothetical protein
VPRLRFTRDERGYEHTFLVHTVRRRGRERTRLLYWFRSPPAVRVGRPALDAEAIRAIEDANPDIAFDWVTILAARPPEPELAEGWRARRGRPARDRDVKENASREVNTSSTLGSLPPAFGNTTGQSHLDVGRQLSNRVMHGSEPPDDREGVVIEPSAVQQALGSEGLVRVRARYAEVLARICSQVADAAAADDLRATAERLNPDAWVTADEVRAGLESFERVLESVRRRLGPPRRHGREQPDKAAPARSDKDIGGRPVPAPHGCSDSEGSSD